MVAPPLSGSFFHTQKCFFFNRYPLVTRESYDFSRLTHPWQTHYRQPPRMDQLITYFQTVIFFFYHSHSLGRLSIQVLPIMVFIRTFLYPSIQGRDATRTSHTSRL